MKRSFGYIYIHLFLFLHLGQPAFLTTLIELTKDELYDLSNILLCILGEWRRGSSRKVREAALRMAHREEAKTPGSVVVEIYRDTHNNKRVRTPFRYTEMKILEINSLLGSLFLQEGTSSQSVELFAAKN